MSGDYLSDDERKTSAAYRSVGRAPPAVTPPSVVPPPLRVRLALRVWDLLNPPLSEAEQIRVLRAALGEITTLVDARHPACIVALRALADAAERRPR